jgi:hypothetical protein
MLNTAVIVNVAFYLLTNRVSSSAAIQNTKPSQPKCTLAGGVGFQIAAITKHTKPNTNRMRIRIPIGAIVVSFLFDCCEQLYAYQCRLMMRCVPTLIALMIRAFL